jgi:hypothetical protein
LLSISLCLSLLVSIPGGAALAADCCVVATESSMTGEISNQGPERRAAAHHHDTGTMAPTADQIRPEQRHEPGSAMDRGLPVQASGEPFDADPAGPIESFPVCGLSICLDFPQVSLAPQPLPGLQISPESIVVIETGNLQSLGFPTTIFRPPRS